jgi:NADH dehydrogenase
VILITGATGFVGHHLVEALLDAGRPVRCLVRQPDRPAVARLREGGAEIVRGDVTDEVNIVHAAMGAEAMIHLVAVIKERGRSTFAEINYRGTVHALDAAHRAGVRRFIHLSALGADPASPYPYLRSKGLAEEAVRQSGLDFTIFRPSVIFGEGCEFVRMLAALVKALPVVPVVGSGQELFQPVWVGDVATVIARAVDDAATIRRTYDLGGPQQLTYNEILAAVEATLGARRPVVHVPMGLARPVAALMTRVLPSPPVTPGQLALLSVPNETDRSATEALAGHPPRPLPGNIDYARRLTFAEAGKAIAGFGLPAE